MMLFGFITGGPRLYFTTMFVVAIVGSWLLPDKFKRQEMERRFSDNRADDTGNKVVLPMATGWKGEWGELRWQGAVWMNWLLWLKGLLRSILLEGLSYPRTDCRRLMRCSNSCAGHWR